MKVSLAYVDALEPCCLGDALYVCFLGVEYDAFGAFLREDDLFLGFFVLDLRALILSSKLIADSVRSGVLALEDLRRGIYK